MIRTKTLFVVGAGASAEFNLPVGTLLQEHVAQLVNVKFRNGHDRVSGDGQITEVIQQKYPQDSNAYFQAGRRIHDAISLSNSIDNFMDVHRNDELIRTMGRLSIVKAIAQAERSSTLSFDRHDGRADIRFSSLSTSWLVKLFRYMQEGRHKDDVENFFENVSFVVFNYDRCVEHFFYRALMKFYNVTDDVAARIVCAAPIVHPYGSIGAMSWQTNHHDAIEYGQESVPLWKASQRIRTYTDQIDDEAALERIHSLVMDAETICFLGFSYQKQNLDILAPKSRRKGGSVLGTAFGISGFDVDRIKAEIREKLARDSLLDNGATDGKCGPFMEKYSRAFL